MWLRLRQIALVAPELEPAVDELRALFGIDVCFRDPGVATFGLVNALLPLGNQFIEIVAPTRDDTAGGRYLERRGGAGGYMVITQCDDHALRRKRVEQLGVRIVNQFQTHEFINMQMHPKDTGGSFFEIDQQLGEGANAVDGPWEPAGGANWKAARHTDRVARISAAEVQVDDPDRVSARWAEIAEVPVVKGTHPKIELDNATVRFVPCTDGRPEGLGGLDIITHDRNAIIAAARARGTPNDGNQIYACGMRFNLL
ncbi:MAG: VOC family protein [Proteobacteria bacterium]|nr:VOC family protein [Pseudomonadota bacterium]